MERERKSVFELGLGKLTGEGPKMFEGDSGSSIHSPG